MVDISLDYPNFVSSYQHFTIYMLDYHVPIKVYCRTTSHPHPSLKFSVERQTHPTRSRCAEQFHHATVGNSPLPTRHQHPPHSLDAADHPTLYK